MEKLTKSLLALGLVLSVTACGSTKLELKQKSLSLELGETISTDLTSYLNTNLKDKDLQNITITPSEGLVLEEGQYPAVGDYLITYTYKDTKLDLPVCVQDNTAPTFDKSQETVELSSKDDESKLSDLFTVSDLSKTELTFDTSKVDYTKQGTYDCTATATDEYDNTTSVNFTIKTPKQEIKLNNSKLSLTVGSTSTLKNTNKNVKDVKFSSSDEKVATVSSSGKVTAKAEGTCTIKATAEGTEKSCTVTVKAKTVASSTPANTSTGSSGSSSSSSSSSGAKNTSGKWAMSDDEIKAYLVDSYKRQAPNYNYAFDSYTHESCVYGLDTITAVLKKSMTAEQIKSTIDTQVGKAMAAGLAYCEADFMETNCCPTGHIKTIDSNTKYVWDHLGNFLHV